VGATRSSGAGFEQIFLDNVRLDAVPEPGSLLLLSLGTAGLLGTVRQRRA